MTQQYRHALPQLSGRTFLTDAGLETDLIFNKGIEIHEFAAHTLLPKADGKAALTEYFCGFLDLAKRLGTGFILDSQTWKAHPHWAADLGESEAELRQANHDAVAFIAALRDQYATPETPIVLNGLIGPRGDAYAPDAVLAADEAQEYHSRQISWLAETDVDMVSALTFTQSDESIGIVRAAMAAKLPIVVALTVETDGRLPTGQPLRDAIVSIDEATNSGPAYYMVNCAHPDHFADVLESDGWTRRIRGLRCNASRLSHAELDNCETLDCGNPNELAGQYVDFKKRLPWLNVFGGCCGSDLRHVTEIAQALAA